MSTGKDLTRGRYIITALVILLIVLHQDNWNWDSTNLIFGLMPVALFWHICISIAAAFVWYLATKIAWPEELEEKVLTDVAHAGDERSRP